MGRRSRGNTQVEELVGDQVRSHVRSQVEGSCEESHVTTRGEEGRWGD